MLYERYGGTVVFQQFNPNEPIGAYRMFVKELEEAGVFEIYSKEHRDNIWHQFDPKHTTVLPPKDVDFDKPWWRKMRKSSN